MAAWIVFMAAPEGTIRELRAQRWLNYRVPIKLPIKSAGMLKCLMFWGGFVGFFFFPYPELYQPHKRILALLETLPLLGKENIPLWLLSLDKHGIIHV